MSLHFGFRDPFRSHRSGSGIFLAAADHRTVARYRNRDRFGDNVLLNSTSERELSGLGHLTPTVKYLALLAEVVLCSSSFV